MLALLIVPHKTTIRPPSLLHNPLHRAMIGDMVARVADLEDEVFGAAKIARRAPLQSMIHPFRIEGLSRIDLLGPTSAGS